MNRFSPLPNRADIIPWREWSEAAFTQARAEDKPVMLFLGAFWCRFCQRMDEQAFSDTEVIALLNAYFIPLRVEYTQRPDVDARYNLNGWPTIAFMAPNGQLLAAVNYLPADQFKELLIDVYMGYEQQKEELRGASQQAEEPKAAARELTDADLATNLGAITDSVMARADRTHGGYDRGQKFIHPAVNDFLLARYEATQDRQYLDQVCLTLERMRAGELYHHRGGAYFRTSSNPRRWNEAEGGPVNMAELCRTFGVSRQTGYKWVNRYCDSHHDLEAVTERSRRPKTSPNALSVDLQDLIVDARKHWPRWGPRKLRQRLVEANPGKPVPSASVIAKVLKQRGLTAPRRRRRDRAVVGVAVPFSGCDRPKAVWCMDLKGWVPTGTARRCYPLTLLDAFSRYLLRCEALVDPDGKHVFSIPLSIASKRASKYSFRDTPSSLVKSWDDPLCCDDVGIVSPSYLTPFSHILCLAHFFAKNTITHPTVNPTQ